MQCVRSVIAIFCFIIFGIGSLPLNLVVLPIAKKILSEKDFIYFSSDVIHYTWGVFINLLKHLGLIQLDIKNPKKLREITNKIIVATHPSFIDILILGSIIPRSTCIVKGALVNNFVISNLVKSIFITKNTDIETFCTETNKMLELGFNLIIFPTGRRHRKNEYPKIQKGAALAAINSRKNIVPVKIYTDRDFLFVNQPFWAVSDKIVTFSIEVGEEIDVSGFVGKDTIRTKKDLTKKIKNSLY